MNLKLASFLRFIPDKLYLSIGYYSKEKKKMHWRNPVLLNEKLQYLKIYNRNPLYTAMVDKIAVKDIIKDKIGENIIIPTIATYDSANDINFEELPQEFVIKCSHDSHSAMICNKSNMDIKTIKKFLKKRLKENLYWLGREWPYKNVKPRILVEKLIRNNDGSPLVDYKFYCYGGKPRYFMYSVGEATHHPINHKFDMNCNSIDHLFKKTPAIPLDSIKLPSNIQDMISIVEKLCVGEQHIRIDLYNVDGKIYFGEITFFSGAGFIHMDSQAFSDELASFIDLSKVYGKKPKA